MGIDATCQHCGKNYDPKYDRCPHCYREGKFPNVFLAELEQPALQQRYRKACRKAASRGVGHLLQQLQDAVDHNFRICINKNYIDVLGLIQENSQFASYYQQIKAGVRLLINDQWDNKREIADTLFFPAFKEHILFAALALDDQGIAYYGPCSLVLKDEMIQERSTLFHENTVLFVIKNRLSLSRLCPKGYRAVWSQKGMLAAAKVEKDLSPTTTPADFPQLLVRQDPAKKGDDVFLEVHIYGSLTLESIKEIIFPAKPAWGMTLHAKVLERELKDKKIAYRRLA